MVSISPAFASTPARVGDAHVHVYDDAHAEAVLDAAARFGVQRVFVSCLGSAPIPFQPTMEW